MTNLTSGSYNHRMGYSEQSRQLLDRRNVETRARHLLAHLRPGPPKEKMARLTTPLRENRTEAQGLDAVIEACPVRLGFGDRL